MLRRPKLGDLEGVSLNITKFDEMTVLISRLADIPPSSAKMLDLDDLPAIGEVLNDFLPTSLPDTPT